MRHNGRAESRGVVLLSNRREQSIELFLGFVLCIFKSTVNNSLLCSILYSWGAKIPDCNFDFVNPLLKTIFGPF